MLFDLLNYLNKNTIYAFENNIIAIHRGIAGAEAYNNLGFALAKQERYGETVIQFEKAVRLRPGFHKPRTIFFCIVLYCLLYS